MMDIVSNIVGEIVSKLPEIGTSLLEAEDGTVFNHTSPVSFLSYDMYEYLRDNTIVIGRAIARNIAIPLMIFFILLEFFWEFVDYNIGKDTFMNRFDFNKVGITLLLILALTIYEDISRGLDNVTNGAVNQMTRLRSESVDELIERQRVLGDYLNQTKFKELAYSEDIGRYKAIMKDYAEGKVPTEDALIKRIEEENKAIEELNASRNPKQNESAFWSNAKNAISSAALATSSVMSGVSQDQIKSFIESIEMTITRIQNFDIGDAVVEIINFLLSLILKLVRGTIELYTFLVQMLIYAIAPLAVLAYAIPGSIGKSGLASILSLFFQTKLWIVLTYVIDLFYTKIYSQVVIQQMGVISNPTVFEEYSLVMMNVIALIFITFYLMIPKLGEILMKNFRQTGLAGLTKSFKEAGQSATNFGKNSANKASSAGSAIKAMIKK